MIDWLQNYEIEPDFHVNPKKYVNFCNFWCNWYLSDDDDSVSRRNRLIRWVNNFIGQFSVSIQHYAIIYCNSHCGSALQILM